MVSKTEGEREIKVSNVMKQEGKDQKHTRIEARIHTTVKTIKLPPI